MSAVINDVLARLVLLEGELYPDVPAKPFPAYFQSGYPYITHQAGIQSIERPSSDVRVYVYRVTIRLFRGTFTEGYEGDIQVQCMEDAEQMVSFFEARPRLSYQGQMLAKLAARGCTGISGQASVVPADEVTAVHRWAAVVNLDVPISVKHTVIG